MAAVGHRNGASIDWSPSKDVGTFFHVENTAFSVVVAGDDDRAAFGFLGSSRRVRLYLALSVVTAVCSLAIGTLFILERGDLLPVIFSA